MNSVIQPHNERAASADNGRRAAIERVAEVFAARPQAARSTSHARAEVGEGLNATVTEGDWTIAFDMPDAGCS